MTTNRHILEKAKQSSTDLLREKMQIFLDNIDLNEETTDEATGLIFMIELAQRLEQARMVLKDKEDKSITNKALLLEIEMLKGEKAALQSKLQFGFDPVIQDY